MSDLEGQLKKLQKHVEGGKLDISNAITANQETEDEGLRELQVLVGGLAEEADEEAVINQVQAVVDSLGFKGKYEQIFTFTDPSKLGVVEFKSVPSKVGFFKRVNQMNAVCPFVRNQKDHFG